MHLKIVKTLNMEMIEGGTNILHMILQKMWQILKYFYIVVIFIYSHLKFHNIF